VTSLDPHQERVKGIEAGADDFLSKPINQPELFARVRSLLRVKRLQDERLARLKSFFSPQLAEAIAAGKGEELLKAHRREITVEFFDLRGFTAFTDASEPEEVMELLGAYHAALGRLVLEQQGTLERFAGDAVMVFFNDPLPVERPGEHAVRTALAMREAFVPIAEHWKKRGGFELGLGVGIAQGYATLGAIGFEGRRDYAAIGNVTNLAARLCGEAAAGQILADRKTMAALDGAFAFEPIGPLVLKGFDKPMPAFALKA
jgi:adenylate cyclase